MSRVFLRETLEGAATFWRVLRRDGVTLGLTSHDRDLWFDGVRHRAAPGMQPSAIRRSADLAPDCAHLARTIREKLRRDLYPPPCEILHRRLTHEVRKPLGEHRARRGDLAREPFERPRLVGLSVEQCKRLADERIAKSRQPASIAG